MASTAERIVNALRETPHTRTSLLFIINDVTSRAILNQLNNLIKHGFVKRTDGRCITYSLITDYGFLKVCSCCGRAMPCWQIKNENCNYCNNARWLGSKKVINRKEAMYAEDDACSIAYQPLLRGQNIGMKY